EEEGAGHGVLLGRSPGVRGLTPGYSRPPLRGSQPEAPKVRPSIARGEALRTPGSGENILHHFAVDVGQPHVAAAEAERQFLVVDTEHVEHRRVEVVDLGLSGHGLVAPLVGLAVDGAALGAAAGQPDAEAVLVVVAAVAALG